MMTPAQTLAASRPRIEGERETEIYGVVLSLLVEGGYDKLTFDAVAAAARVSKATLYRRWSGKPELVLDAFTHDKAVQPVPADTGSLREDLLTMACGPGGVCGKSPALLGALFPALQRDPELFAAFRARVVEPPLRVAVEVMQRAQRRGEIASGVDLDLLAITLPALCIHESVLHGTPITRERVSQILDTVVLPAARRGLDPGTTGS
ncbi:MAG TPA: TetR/AcrR family transcriptional regulator [Dermatophilaceae bacterium]|nr:TetR/AcrR family transcriptional regulator [Dermatophilaceae bacterium]